MASELTFEELVVVIQNIHEHFSTKASPAVNISLTLRNWIMGSYIYEYEQNGEDHARYGEHLLDHLAERLHQAGMKRVDARELRRCRQFYLTYPQIREALTPESRSMLPAIDRLAPMRESVTPELSVNEKTILERLSFTHLAELMKIEDPIKSVFYEIECIRGNCSTSCNSFYWNSGTDSVLRHGRNEFSSEIPTISSALSFITAFSSATCSLK